MPPSARFCRLKANANSGKTPRRLGRRPETQIRNTQSSAASQWLLDGLKRDGCVVRNFADVDEMAHEAMQHSHALCPAVCLGHREKLPAVDKLLHTFCLAPSTRHDPHSCAHAQLNGGPTRQFPSFQASAPATWALWLPITQSRLCKQVPKAAFFCLRAKLTREGTHHETDAN